MGIQTNLGTLLMAKPETVASITQKLGVEMRRLTNDPTAKEHIRETHMDLKPSPSTPTPEQLCNENGLLHALLESSSTTGRNEGRAVTKMQLGLLSTVVGVLWLSTMSLGGIIWNDMRSRLTVNEERIQATALDVSGLKNHDEEQTRRLGKIDDKLDVIADRQNEVLQRLAAMEPKPK